MPARVGVWGSLWGWIGLRRCWRDTQAVAKVKRWSARCQEWVRSYECMEASVYDSKRGDLISRWRQSAGEGLCRAERMWPQDWDELGKEGPGSHSSGRAFSSVLGGERGSQEDAPSVPAWLGCLKGWQAAISQGSEGRVSCELCQYHQQWCSSSSNLLKLSGHTQKALLFPTQPKPLPKWQRNEFDSSPGFLAASERLSFLSSLDAVKTASSSLPSLYVGFPKPPLDWLFRRNNPHYSPTRELVQQVCTEHNKGLGMVGHRNKYGTWLLLIISLGGDAMQCKKTWKTAQK